MKIFCFIKVSIILLCFGLSSCATRIDAALASDGSLAMNVSTSLQPRITALVQRMFSLGGQDGLVLNGAEIAQSMSNAPGVTSVSFRNVASAAIDGQIRISQINDFLAAAGETTFITFEQGTSGGRCEININRNNGPVIIVLFSPVIADYLNAFMAPIVTGDELTTDEYIELVSSFYNQAISDEIAASRIRLAVDFPGSVTSVRGGTFSGNRASFDIPLVELLVLETPMVFEVRWN